MPDANLVVCLYDGAHVPAARLLSATGQADLVSALEELIASIRANPLWSRLPGAVLIGRYDPVPLLAVAGTFTDEQQVLLGELQDQLDLLLEKREIVDYSRAEAVCGQLADRLVSAFGRDNLNAAQFAAIPRGGFIVLGMLAYHLDLRPDQLTTLDAASPDKTLFVIDDCSLSGTRFRESLSRVASDSVVFCPLYAPETLCAGITSCEPRVLACLAGATLEDTSPAPGEAGYSAWYQQRLARLGDATYWIGQPLGVAFAWCTPQTRQWDETEGRFVEGWDVVPPSRCLNRRLLLRRLESGADAAVLPQRILNVPSPEPDIRAASRVLWCCLGDDVIVAKIPQQPGDVGNVLGLAGIAADFWQMLMKRGSVEVTIEGLLERYMVSREQLESDMSPLLQQLLSEGLLVRDTSWTLADGDDR